LDLLTKNQTIILAKNIYKIKKIPTSYFTTIGVTADLAAILPAPNSAESCKDNHKEEKHEEGNTEITLISMRYFEANKPLKKTHCASLMTRFIHSDTKKVTTRFREIAEHKTDSHIVFRESLSTRLTHISSFVN
jgi:hypothetical protein